MRGISLAAISEQTIVTGPRSSFYSIPKGIVWMNTAVIVLLVFIIFVLLLSIKRRKQAEKRPEISEEKHRLLSLNECFLGFGENPDENINHLVAVFGKLMKATCAFYNRLDGTILIAVGKWNEPEDYQLQDNAEGHICFDIISQQYDNTVVLHNLNKSKYAETDPSVKKYGLRTYIGRAVKFANVCKGSLCAVFTEDVVPTYNDEQLMNFTASAIAVEEERKKAKEKLKVLYEMSKKITSITKREELLPWIAEQARELLGADNCFYRIKEGEYLKMGGSTEKKMTLLFKDKIKIGESLSGIIASEKRPLTTGDVKKDPRCIEEHKKIIENYGYASFLGVPMMIDDRVVGVINVHSKTPDKFTEKDVELLSSFADHAAIAFENARLFEDLEEARSELVQWNKELEEKVEERTKELKEVYEQLLHSERLAATGRLGASVAHEINNPLQALDSFISAAIDGLEEGDKKEYLNLSLKAVRQIAKITRQLSSFFRPDRQTRVLININTIVENALLLTRNQLSLKNIKLIEELSPDLSDIEVSSQQIQQVLVNLILNAQDAMPDGGELRISTREENRSVFVDIMDTGQGISEEIVDRIFEPFFTTKKIKGSGLGLSISYGIIRAHSGDISVKSRKGEGTTFTIRLPLKKSGLKKGGFDRHDSVEKTG
jgi:signal transduction histidine kinase